jgi:hypothetical protein
VTISSIARLLPTMRTSRCVPPVPGSTPSVTSGRPTLPSPSRDAQVGRHGDLEAAADGVAVERGDHQLRRLLEAVQRLVGVQAEVVLEGRVRRLEHVDVGAGAEELLARAGEHDHVHVVVEARLEDRRVELAHHLVGVGVGRRVVEGQVGDPLADLVVHQRENPAIESVIYLRGRVLAAKRTAYDRLINQGKGEKEIAALMEHQHRTIVAAIRAGRFDGRIEQASAMAKSPDATGTIPPREERPVADPFGGGGDERPALAVDALRSAALADEEGPTLDQVILDYLSAEAEQEHLVLVLDGHEEIQPGRTNELTVRAYSSKSGLPVSGVKIAVKMLSTVEDPRTLLTAETDGIGSLEFQLDVPATNGGSVALVISGASDLGRAEIKQLL